MTRRHEIWDEGHVNRLVTQVWGDVNHQRGRHWDIQQRVARKIPEGSDVLEIAPGVGHLYGIIKDKVKSYRGRDVSPAMIDQFKQYFPDADVSWGDAYDLQDEPTSQIVVSVDMLMHLPGDLSIPIQQMWSRTGERLIFTIRFAGEGKDPWIIERKYTPMPGGSEPTKDGKVLIIRGETKQSVSRIFETLPNLKEVEEEFYDERTSILILWREKDDSDC